MLFVQRLAVWGGLTMSASSDHDQSERHDSHDNSPSAQQAAVSFHRVPLDADMDSARRGVVRVAMQNEWMGRSTRSVASS
jgi:hypothetical protein